MSNRLKACKDNFNKIRWMDESWDDIENEILSLTDDNWTQFIKNTREHYEDENREDLDAFIFSVANLIGRI